MATSIWRIGGIDVSQYVSVGSTISSNKDETLDNGQLTLVLTNSEALSKEKNGVMEYYDGSESHYFDIVSDLVEPVQRGDSVIYKHTVQYASVSRRFAFSLAKGMDFKQPKNGGKIIAKDNGIIQSVPDYALYTFEDVGYNETPAYLYPRMSVVSAKIKVGLYQITEDTSSVRNAIVRDSVHYYSAIGIGYRDTVDGEDHLLFDVNGSFHDKSEIILTPTQIAQINAKKGKYLSVFHRIDYFFFPEEDDLVISNISLEINSYYYTYSDVINQVIRGCQRPNDDLTTETPLAQLPSSGSFREFLDSTIAPNLQFTQGETLWECLMKIYNCFDAKPKVDGDGDVPTLGVDYYNEKGNQLDSGLFVASSVGLNDDKRVNGLVCRYQNGIAPNPTNYPAKDKMATARCSSIGVPANNDYNIIVGSPIQSLVDVKTRIYSVEMRLFGDTSFLTVASDVFIDLMDVIYEKSLWSQLDASTTTTLNHTQYNSLWYESGSNRIYVGALENTVDGSSYSYGRALELAFGNMIGATYYDTSFGFAVGTDGGGYPCFSSHVMISSSSSTNDYLKPWEMNMSVSYIPEQNGCVRVEGEYKKRDGEMLVNQSSALTDLSRMGANMYGLSLRTGEEKRSKAYAIDDFASMPKSGSWYKDGDGSLWIVQTAKATIYDEGVKCELELTRNFNQMSQRIAIERQVTFNGIERSLALDSETIYQEYVYLVTAYQWGAGERPTLSPIHVTDVSFVEGAISALCTDESSWWINKKVDFASVGGNVYMPIVSYSAGTGLCFEGGFDDPISAGNRLSATAGWFTTNLNSNVVQYADNQGFLDKANLLLCNGSAVSLYDSLPRINAPSSNLVSFSNLEIEKRPNDVFRFNYELVLLPYKGGTHTPFLVYPQLAKNCQFMTGLVPSRIRIFVLSSSDSPYSGFEAKPKGTEIIPSSKFRFVSSVVSSSSQEYETSATLYDGETVEYLATIYGYMITDDLGNPLLAYSDFHGGQVVIHCFGSHNRQ